MICPKCGNEVPDFVSTCPNCGQILKGDASTTNQTSAQPVMQNADQEYGQPQQAGQQLGQGFAQAQQQLNQGFAQSQQAIQQVSSQTQQSTPQTIKDSSNGKGKVIIIAAVAVVAVLVLAFIFLRGYLASAVTASPKTIYVKVNDSKIVSSEITPGFASAKVKWKSSDSSVATVNDNGSVKGVKEGKTTVTVSTVNGKTDTCDVVVSQLYENWKFTIIFDNVEYPTYVYGEADIRKANKDIPTVSFEGDRFNCNILGEKYSGTWEYNGEVYKLTSDEGYPFANGTILEGDGRKKSLVLYVLGVSYVAFEL